MPTTSGSITELLAPDLRKVYFETGKERPAEYPFVFDVYDMPYNGMTDQQMAGLGTMPSMPENEPFPTDDPIMGSTKTYTANPYGLSVEISWIAWRDELYGALREMIRGIAKAGRYREEVSAWSALNNAFSTSYTGFTASESLCSTSHTGLDGTTRANRPSTDIGFSITGIQASITRFETQTDERDMPALIAPQMFLIAPQNRFTAREILGSPKKPYTTDNEINALIDEDETYMVCHHLTTSTYWFNLAAKGSHDLQFGWRDRPIFDMFDDPFTKGAVVTGYQRHTLGEWGSWRGIDGSTG